LALKYDMFRRTAWYEQRRIYNIITTFLPKGVHAVQPHPSFIGLLCVLSKQALSS